MEEDIQIYSPTVMFRGTPCMNGIILVVIIYCVEYLFVFFMTEEDEPKPKYTFLNVEPSHTLFTL